MGTHQLDKASSSMRRDSQPGNISQNGVERGGSIHVAPEHQVAEAAVVVQRYVTTCTIIAPGLS